MEHPNTVPDGHQHMQKFPQNRHAVIVAPAIHQGNAWLMGRSVKTMTRLVTSGECVEVREQEW